MAPSGGSLSAPWATLMRRFGVSGSSLSLAVADSNRDVVTSCSRLLCNYPIFILMYFFQIKLLFLRCAQCWKRSIPSLR